MTMLKCESWLMVAETEDSLHDPRPSAAEEEIPHMITKSERMRKRCKSRGKLGSECYLVCVEGESVQGWQYIIK